MGVCCRMIPIIDDKKNYDSLVENCYLLAKWKANESAPCFFLSLHVHFSTPFDRIASQPFPLSQFSIPKSGISVTSRELQEENKGKTSYSGVPTRQTTEGTDVLENRFWTEASKRSNADGPLKGKEIGLLIKPIPINCSTPAGRLCSTLFRRTVLIIQHTPLLYLLDQIRPYPHPQQQQPAPRTMQCDTCSHFTSPSFRFQEGEG